jgi:hypothetical protein
VTCVRRVAALALCGQLRNWSLKQSQESGVASPRNQIALSSNDLAALLLVKPSQNLPCQHGVNKKHGARYHQVTSYAASTA